jgi:hypothetical protein
MYVICNAFVIRDAFYVICNRIFPIGYIFFLIMSFIRYDQSRVVETVHGKSESFFQFFQKSKEY